MTLTLDTFLTTLDTFLSTLDPAYQPTHVPITAYSWPGDPVLSNWGVARATCGEGQSYPPWQCSEPLVCPAPGARPPVPLGLFMSTLLA